MAEGNRPSRKVAANENLWRGKLKISDAFMISNFKNSNDTNKL